MTPDLLAQLPTEELRTLNETAYTLASLTETLLGDMDTLGEGREAASDPEDFNDLLSLYARSRLLADRDAVKDIAAQLTALLAALKGLATPPPRLLPGRW